MAAGWEAGRAGGRSAKLTLRRLNQSCVVQRRQLLTSPMRTSPSRIHTHTGFRWQMPRRTEPAPHRASDAWPRDEQLSGLLSRRVDQTLLCVCDDVHNAVQGLTLPLRSVGSVGVAVLRWIAIELREVARLRLLEGEDLGGEINRPKAPIRCTIRRYSARPPSRASAFVLC